MHLLNIGTIAGTLISLAFGAFMIWYAFYRKKRKPQSPTKPKVVDNSDQWHDQERMILAEINGYRSSKGLPRLKPSKTITEQAEERTLEHARLDPKVWREQGHDLFPMHAARLRAKGYSHCIEVIGRHHETGKKVVTGWKNSPSHREALKNSHATHIGISRYMKIDQGKPKPFYTAILARY